MKYLSVCSGIEAASVAWGPLGWKPVAFAEIEPFPCAVLVRHYPDVPNLGDMTKIDGAAYRGQVDVLVGGTPCQSFSVAGLRRGLSDERGNLTLRLVELADAVQPSFVVWENVPGVLSSKDNAFGCFLGGLSGFNGELFPSRAKGVIRWSSAGCVFGPRRTVAWRTLDAQYFGVPQRRRRVFVVACPRDGADPLSILFEFDGLRRDTPPCRKKREDITSSLTASLGAGGPDDNRAQGGFYVPEIVAQAMTCKWSKGTSGSPGDEHHNLVVAFHGSQDPCVSGCVTHPVGRNQGQETCIAAIHPHCIGRSPEAGPQGKEYLDDGSAYTMDTKPPQAIASRTAQTSSNGYGFSNEVAHTLDGANGQAVAFAQNQIGEVRTGEVAGTLNRNTSPSGRNTPMVFTETAPTMGSSGPPYSRTGNSRIEAEAVAATGYGVRRLTPRECERLQGFPDDYTRIPWRGRAEENCPDGPRYQSLGNSMPVPVMHWIGKRIHEAAQKDSDKN